MHRIFHAAAGLLIALVLTCPASAAVVDQAANGFAIQQTLLVAAAPDKVYATLIKPALWWSSHHTYSQSATNLSIDARGGGCFCEALANGGSVQHAVVAVAIPGEMLRLRGPLGPFQGQGVDGAITFTLKPAGGGTDIVLDNIVGGYMKGGFSDWPVKADGMLAEQMARLKSYLETGSPDDKH